MDDKEKYAAFGKEAEELIYEWYTGCPRPLQIVTKLIRLYKNNIGEIHVPPVKENNSK
jgi:hypothetical protein